MPSAKFLDSRNGVAEWVECDIINSSAQSYYIKYFDSVGRVAEHFIDKALVKLPSFSELIM